MDLTLARAPKSLGGGKICLSSIGFSDARFYPNAFFNSAGMVMGGWQAKFEQTIAAVAPAFTAGKLGIVSAKAGGRFWGTALLAERRITDLFKANPAQAAE